jgi:tetratricopeptide (TPR) repeat protein
MERSTQRIRSYLVLFVVLVSGSAPGQGPGNPEILWRTKSGYSLAPSALAVDVNLDGSLEILLVSLEGRVSLHSSAKGKRMWERRLDLTGRVAFPAVAGHFVNDDTIDIFLATSDGDFVLLDGLTGEPILSIPMGFAPVAPPAVFPIERGGAAGASYAEGAIVMNDRGELRGYAFKSDATPEIVFRASITDGVVDATPAVGLTGYGRPGPHVVTATNEGRVYVFSAAPNSNHSISFALGTGSRRDIWIALGDLSGDGRDDIAVIDDEGFLYAYRIVGDRPELLWDKSSVSTRPNFDPAIVDVNGDGREDVLVAPQTQGNQILLLVNGATGRRDIWDVEEHLHPYMISSPLAAFRGADGRAYLVFGASQAGGYVSVFDILSRRHSSLEVKAIVKTTPIVGPIRPSSDGGASLATAQALIVGWREGAEFLVDLKIDWPSDGLPWFGEKGGGRRTSNLSARHRDFLRGQSDKFAEAVRGSVRLAEEHYEQRRWAEARRHAATALKSDPHHVQARRIHRSAFVREKLVSLIAGLVFSLLVTALVAWQGSVWIARRVRLNLAGRALAREDEVSAARLMLAVHRSAPKNKEHLKTLAGLYISLKDFTGETAEVFARARETFPEEDRYARALASSYSQARRNDEAAARAYEDMVRISSKPGPWAFVLGQTFVEMGRDREALDAFHRAVRHGFNNPSLPSYLSDLYVKLQITQPEILPTMQRVLDERLNDRDFLSVYCKACQQARFYDESAHRAAEALLKLDPAPPEAHVILSSRHLHAGQIKSSMTHAQAVLENSPNDSVGLRLLGACYAAENRLDDTAMQIFDRALRANPEAPEILVAVSHGYIQAGREDDEARGIYERAIAANPNEDTILFQLARIARRQSNDELTVGACEQLLKLGRHSRELILQLAEAYCRLGVLEEKAEPVYREALIFQPDHASVANHLATIYLRQGRTDAEAAAVYEAVHHRDPTRRDVARRLAFAYREADMADRTLELARSILVEDPHDDEIEKLAAQASEALDQMDSAMAAYEQVLERNPDDREALCRLASIYGRKRLHDDRALSVYDRAIRLRRDSLEFHSALARAWAARDDWEKVVSAIKHLLSHASDKISSAAALMEELIETAPKALKLRWFLVETLIYDGRLREANEHLSEILRIDSSQAQQALASFERILNKNPRDARAHQQRGRLLIGMDREAEARHALEQAYRFAASDEGVVRDLMDLYQRLLEKREANDVRFQLGKLAIQTGKFDLAISCFQKTDKDYRWENESIRCLARCFMAKGMLDLALQELRRIPVEDAAKDLLYELGQRYEAVNDPPGAREVYKMIFAVDIGFKDVKGKLEALVGGSGDPMAAERTAIMNTLSDEAKARYDLIQELGRGAMGIVYKARDNELEEMVALKILPDSLGQNPDALRRFRQEARNARRLSHPSIVRIHDIGEELGRKYISMEFVNGTDLKERLKECKRKLPLKEMLSYSRQVCEALIAAHDSGIVHRDIKPANIMITKNGRVKVTDFGIAKMVLDESHADVTRVGAVVGTPLYMSPEQVKGDSVDNRADLYSLGVLMYEMLAGQPPFYEGDLAYHHVFTKPKPIGKEHPEDAARIVMKCLQKDPGERYQNARELLEDLKRIKIAQPAEATG